LRTLDRFPVRPLASSVIGLLALSAPLAAAATTWTVDSCDQGNSGDLGTHTGTLRFAASNAASGDDIDLTGLSCGRISLQTGAIRFNQNDIRVIGPGRDALTISGDYVKNTNTYSDEDRVLRHTGSGVFEVDNVTISDGYLNNPTGSSKGGCIYTKGTLYLYGTTVANCWARTTTGEARGGGVYATAGAFLLGSDLRSNQATSGSTGNAVGGGIFSAGYLAMYVGSIDGNTARGTSGTRIGVGGGAFSGGDTVIVASTVSHNVAGRNAGGIDAFNAYPSTLTAFVAESTISGNSAGYLVGGIYANSHDIEIENSTIAFNLANARFRQYSTTAFGAGMAASALFGAVSIRMDGTLVANNAVKTKDFDLSTPYASNHPVTFNAAPAGNLVRVADPATASALPADTLSSCPLLGPLRDNGGLTLTHALLSASPGIDAGQNPDADTFDQRGPPYLRESGGAADIGAYELQQDDIVFDAGFDGCLPI
jgi:hypothetical protein